MKEKIFNALKAAILVGGKTSVSDATINMYVGLIDLEKIKEESQIADAIKPYVPLLQATQANINSVAASSVTAKESELKTGFEKQLEELKKSIPNQQEPPKEKSDVEKTIEAAFASYSEKVITPLVQSIQTMQGEKTHQTLSEKLAGILTEKKVPDWYSSDILEGRTFKDENEVNSWAEKIGEKWAVRNQELANNGFKDTVPPAGGAGDTPKDGDIIADMIKEGTKEIVEQQKQN